MINVNIKINDQTNNKLVEYKNRLAATKAQCIDKILEYTLNNIDKTQFEQIILNDKVDTNQTQVDTNQSVKKPKSTWDSLASTIDGPPDPDTDDTCEIPIDENVPNTYLHHTSKKSIDITQLTEYLLIDEAYNNITDDYTGQVYVISSEIDDNGYIIGK